MTLYHPRNILFHAMLILSESLLVVLDAFAKFWGAVLSPQKFTHCPLCCN
jgi:hypothetical protein